MVMDGRLELGVECDISLCFFPSTFPSRFITTFLFTGAISGGPESMLGDNNSRRGEKLSQLENINRHAGFRYVSVCL